MLDSALPVFTETSIAGMTKSGTTSWLEDIVNNKSCTEQDIDAETGT
jgi:hypothetical protein